MKNNLNEELIMKNEEFLEMKNSLNEELIMKNEEFIPVFVIQTTVGRKNLSNSAALQMFSDSSSLRS